MHQEVPMPVDFGLQLREFPYDAGDADLLGFYGRTVAALPARRR